MLGNFQHDPDRTARVVRSLDEMTTYFREHMHRQVREGGDGLVHALAAAEVDGGRLTEDEVVANSIITMVGGQETTTNLIGNGVLSLLRHPATRAPASRRRGWRRRTWTWVAAGSSGARRSSP
ncbi:MAG: cytochrome P450 [Chloroflexi bacterium]|nr:MAG: cytochrome P450 [Chloroflexota bacterium]